MKKVQVFQVDGLNVRSHYLKVVSYNTVGLL